MGMMGIFELKTSKRLRGGVCEFKSVVKIGNQS